MTRVLSFFVFIFLFQFNGFTQDVKSSKEIRTDVTETDDLGYITARPTGGSSTSSISSIPNPKDADQHYYVANPDAVLNESTVRELNEILEALEVKTKAEFAIVVVDDYIGDSDFEFALALFNTWGIGKKDANNGLLLFIAKNRHEYRFISGYGMEGLLPDVYLKRIGEKYLVPNFRNEDYDQGVLEASRFIAEVLESPDSIKELERLMPEAVSFWSFKNSILLNSLSILVLLIVLYLYTHVIVKKILPPDANQARLFVPIFQGCGCMGVLMFFTIFIFAFVFANVEEVYQISNIPYFVLILSSLILAMKITEGRSLIKNSFKDAEQRDTNYIRYLKFIFIPMLITPLSWTDLFMISKSLISNRGRFTPPDASGDWERIVRSEASSDKGMLEQGQRGEERIGARKYEIWKNKLNGKLELIPWEINSRYKLCPKCGFYTLELNSTRTIRAATYSSSGEGEQFDKCHNCSYRLDKGKFVIPKKVRSSSSSGGGSSSSGRSSSSGGSFGGGSSGGGGAGGRW